MTARALLGLLVVVSAAGGCGGRVDDKTSRKTRDPSVRILGAGAKNSDGAGSGGAGAVGNASSSGGTSVDADRDTVSPADAGHEGPVEVWVGQVAHKLTSRGNSGPDAPPEHVVLALFEVDGVAGGSIVFGNAPRLPKPTDPDAFYPPITPASTYSEQEMELSDIMGRPFDGQPYSLFNVHRSGTRLTFEVMSYELWKDWCTLQPKTYLIPERTEPENKFSCAPPISAGSSPEVGKETLCLSETDHPCQCDEKSCHAEQRFALVVDLELRGESFEGLAGAGKGSVAGIWGYGIKLRRVQ